MLIVNCGSSRLESPNSRDSPRGSESKILSSIFVFSFTCSVFARVHTHTRSLSRVYLGWYARGAATISRESAGSVNPNAERSEKTRAGRVVHAGCYELTARLRSSGFSLNSFKRRSASLRKRPASEELGERVTTTLLSPPFKAEFQTRVTRRGIRAWTRTFALFSISYSLCVYRSTRRCVCSRRHPQTKHLCLRDKPLWPTPNDGNNNRTHNTTQLSQGDSGSFGEHVCPCFADTEGGKKNARMSQRELYPGWKIVSELSRELASSIHDREDRLRSNTRYTHRRDATDRQSGRTAELTARRRLVRGRARVSSVTRSFARGGQRSTEWRCDAARSWSPPRGAGNCREHGRTVCARQTHGFFVSTRLVSFRFVSDKIKREA